VKKLIHHREHEKQKKRRENQFELFFKIHSMPKIDPRVDTYIAKSADFAKPILLHLRKLVHKACPDVEEMIKWSFPCYEYKGPFCSMAAFKQHAAFGFWKAAVMNDPNGLLQIKMRGAMGHFDRITSVKDLPSDKIMLAYIKEAVRLNDEGIKLPPRVKKTATKIVPPAELLAALTKNKKASSTFDQFNPSHKREYIEWITEAKTEPTRNKRIATAIEYLSDGKPLNWKYQKK
jgi:uncharacterized protein YdeI (YjbR/CyaY-like superfamily)